VIRLHVLVEGQTEEQFTKSILGPHLAPFGVWVHPLIVETSRDRHGTKRRGGGDWQKWRKDLLRLTRGQPGPDVRFTTIFDLHGLPEKFPGLAEHGAIANTIQRAELLEAAMAADIQDWRLIPYLQRHEFEALVLAGLDALEELLDAEQRKGVAPLKALIAAKRPEDVNDGPETAPSKRLEAAIPTYRKTVHGPLVVEATGLAKLRAACPRFNVWVTRLEGLSAAGGPTSPNTVQTS
jgi:Domain of unknown function (DUF4276)